VPRYRDLLFVNAAFVLGAGLLALFFAREDYVRTGERIRFHLLRDVKVILAIPNLLVLYLTLFAYSLTYYGSGAIMTVFILELMPGAAAGPAGTLNFWVGTVAVVFTVGSALLVPAWGFAMSRLSPARLLTICLLAGGLAGLPVVLVQSPLQLAVARFVTGVCTVGIGPCALALIKACSPTRRGSARWGWAPGPSSRARSGRGWDCGRTSCLTACYSWD